MRNCRVSVELDVGGRYVGFKTIGLRRLYADKWLPVQAQFKRLAVELSRAAQFQRAIVGRVLILGHRYLTVKGQLADAVDSRQASVGQAQLLDHRYVQRRRGSFIRRAAGRT